MIIKFDFDYINFHSQNKAKLQQRNKRNHQGNCSKIHKKLKYFQLRRKTAYLYSTFAPENKISGCVKRLGWSREAYFINESLVQYTRVMDTQLFHYHPISHPSWLRQLSWQSVVLCGNYLLLAGQLTHTSAMSAQCRRFESCPQPNY